MTSHHNKSHHISRHTPHHTPPHYVSSVALTVHYPRRYAKPQPENRVAVLLFNLDGVTQRVTMELASVGFEGKAVHIRDIWNRTDFPDGGPTVSALLQPYDSALLMLSPKDPRDTTGPHPFTKIDEAWAARINRTQYDAFHRNPQHCSHHRCCYW